MRKRFILYACEEPTKEVGSLIAYIPNFYGKKEWREKLSMEKNK